MYNINVVCNENKRNRSCIYAYKDRHTYTIYVSPKYSIFQSTQYIMSMQEPASMQISESKPIRLRKQNYGLTKYVTVVGY